MNAIPAFDLGFRIRSARVGSATFLVSVSGELDLAAVPELSRTLVALDGRPAPRIVVDVSDVTFIDSTALGALLGEARSRRLAGGELVLVCDDLRTLRVLEVTGLASAFTIARTLRDVLEGVG